MIALVDDEKNVRLGIKTALKHEGFETCEFCNGKEAYDAVKGGLNAELFVMDIMMPVMDGIQTLRKFREEGIKTPVMILTSRDVPCGYQFHHPGVAGKNRLAKKIFFAMKI